MVHLNKDMPTSWRVFVTWLDAVKVFFSQWKGSCDLPPLLSSLDVQPFVLLSTPVHYFLSECTKLLIWLLLVFLLSLWWISYFLQPHDGLFPLHWELIRPHAVASQQQLPNANSTLEINSRPFTCLIDEDITKNSPHCQWNSFESIVQLLLVPWKEGGPRGKLTYYRAGIPKPCLPPIWEYPQIEAQTQPIVII